MKRLGVLSAVVSTVLAVLSIAVARPRVAASTAQAKEKSDSYTLPPENILPQVSMGYRSALADLIWAHVLVTQGIRMGERRPFDNVERYLDAINTLDPPFREPYRLADSLMSFQNNDPDRAGSTRSARRIIERGVRERPNDAELWLDLGQFLAYIGPSALPTDEEREQWRRDGAAAMARAGELGGEDDIILAKSISAVSLLSKRGENEAALHLLEKIYGMTEDPEAKADIERRIRVVLGGQRESSRMQLAKAFDVLWAGDLPFVRRGQLSVLGPPVRVWQCAGTAPVAQRPRKDCSHRWADWAKVVLDDAAGP